MENCGAHGGRASYRGIHYRNSSRIIIVIRISRERPGSRFVVVSGWAGAVSYKTDYLNDGLSDCLISQLNNRPTEKLKLRKESKIELLVIIGTGK